MSKNVPEKTPEQLETEAKLNVIKRRVDVLKVITLDPSTKALAADVPMKDLIPFLDGLRALGLIDRHERLTPAGALYRAIYAALVENGLDPLTDTIGRREVWGKIGGSEDHLDAAAQALRFADLLFEHTDEPRSYALVA